MTGTQRREQILQMIENSTRPLPAKQLAAELSVSRQVIVQDIALLRSSGYDILSTNRGYLLLTEEAASRLIKVSHTDAQMEDELCTIVDLGARVDNVMVNHRVYGHIEAPLRIASRKDIRGFLQKLKESSSTPLKNTTSGYHYHRVCAGDEVTLDEVEAALKEKGYLVEKTE
ncbi:MAG: transcription repressor NadR [Firmicutes bacterium]|nr:transcription repressor NadR [Bacillota bacterium]